MSYTTWNTAQIRLRITCLFGSISDVLTFIACTHSSVSSQPFAFGLRNCTLPNWSAGNPASVVLASFVSFISSSDSVRTAKPDVILPRSAFASSRCM